MTELRTDPSLCQVPGLTPLYQVVPGEDRKADVCIGMVATTELAELIVGAVNGELPQLDAAEGFWRRRIDDLRAEWERRSVARERQAVRAERARIASWLREMRTVDRLAPLADEIEGFTDGT